MGENVKGMKEEERRTVSIAPGVLFGYLCAVRVPSIAVSAEGGATN